MCYISFLPEFNDNRTSITLLILYFIDECDIELGWVFSSRFFRSLKIPRNSDELRFAILRLRLCLLLSICVFLSV